MRLPKGDKRKKKKTEKKIEETMAENLVNLLKNNNLHIQKSSTNSK